jgi:hypothetical protein
MVTSKMASLHEALEHCDVVAVQDCLTPDNARLCCEGEQHEPLDTLCRSSSMYQRPADFLECTGLLIKAGATADTSGGALHLCINRADSETLAKFLKITKADPNHIGCTPHPPLLLALIVRSVPGVRVLLEAGADPSLGESHGKQVAFAISPSIPLHEAVAWGRWDVVQDLLAYGADPFQKDPIRGLAAINWARHAASSSSSSTDSARILAFFEHLEHARNMHLQRAPLLHKELVEYVFQPVRLQKQGYFDM